MTIQLTRPDGLVLTDDPARLDAVTIHRWLSTSYWASERSLEQVERSIANSYCLGAYHSDDGQVGLVRAITDLATFAWLGDVFVAEQWRGSGVGTWLASTMTAHLFDAGVPRVLLATRDAHDVYARIGFGPLRVPATFMEIDRRTNRPEPADVKSWNPEPDGT